MTQDKQLADEKKSTDESPWAVLFAIAFLFYIIVGVLWADAHPDDRNSLIGMDVLDFLSQVLLWPLHLIGILPF